jgi:hypothetical protein
VGERRLACLWARLGEISEVKARPVVGVLVGGIVDILATNVFAAPVVIYVLLTHHLVGAPDGAQSLARIVGSDPSLGVAMWFLGGAASVLGGFTAAWIARGNELLVGALSAYLCTVFGVAALSQATSGTSLALHLAGFLVSPLLGALGGYLRRLQTRRAVHA